MEDKSLERNLLAAYDTYADAIFRHCYYKTGERELAQDLTQEVYLKTWSYMQKQPVHNMRAFLYRIADNLVIDWYRKRKPESLDILMDNGFEPVETGSQIEEQVDVSLALEKLRELEVNDRELITLRFVEGLSPSEIGEILGKNVNTVSVRLHRAIERLRALFQ